LISQPLTTSDCCDFTGIFQRFVDLAPSHGFRAIAANRRDYQGSTPYTPSEMQAIQTTPVAAEDTRAFMKDRAGETAGFIKHLVEDVGISALHDGRGGVVILAWSLGSVYAFNFLDMVKTLPTPLSAVVTRNVRGLIVYGGSWKHGGGYLYSCTSPEPPFEGVALSPPAPGLFNYASTIMARFIDPADPGNAANMGKGLTAINDWLSGWFQYPSLGGADPNDLSDADKLQRYVVPETSPLKPSTYSVEAMDPAFLACADHAAISNETAVLQGFVNGVFAASARSVLFSDPGAALWPGMRVEYVFCANSNWTCVYAAEAIRPEFERAVLGRKVHVIDDANHFVR
jgi:hypothetical protein